MTRYLSLLGLLLLGVGALALANSTATAPESKSLPDDASRNPRNQQGPLLAAPSFHARFSLN